MCQKCCPEMNYENDTLETEESTDGSVQLELPFGEELAFTDNINKC